LIAMPFSVPQTKNTRFLSHIIDNKLLYIRADNMMQFNS
jgi:hypothetical protein